MYHCIFLFIVLVVFFLVSLASTSITPLACTQLSTSLLLNICSKEPDVPNPMVDKNAGFQVSHGLTTTGVQVQPLFLPQHSFHARKFAFSSYFLIHSPSLIPLLFHQINTCDSVEAERLLSKYGRNELPEKHVSKWVIFGQLLIQPMPCMIWVAAFIELTISNYLGK